MQGPFQTIPDIADECFVATRDAVSGRPDPAIRIFIGDTTDRKVGDAFDSHHARNGMPCGGWTIIATAQGGPRDGGQSARRYPQAPREQDRLVS